MNALEKVKDEIKQALLNSERALDSVQLIVASKYLTIDQISRLYQLGQRDFGESKVQDAIEKIDALKSDIRWHFIGHLQKNKISKVIGKFDLIQSVDSLELAQKISEKSLERQPVLLQLNLSGEASKSGFTELEFFENLKAIESLDNIEVKGLMTMAPHSEDPHIIRSVFAHLAKIKEQCKASKWKLSMGMSTDFKIAIEQGANYVRLGSRFKSI